MEHEWGDLIDFHFDFILHYKNMTAVLNSRHDWPLCCPCSMALRSAVDENRNQEPGNIGNIGPWNMQFEYIRTEPHFQGLVFLGSDAHQQRTKEPSTSGNIGANYAYCRNKSQSNAPIHAPLPVNIPVVEFVVARPMPLTRKRNLSLSPSTTPAFFCNSYCVFFTIILAL